MDLAANRVTLNQLFGTIGKQFHLPPVQRLGPEIAGGGVRLLRLADVLHVDVTVEMRPKVDQNEARFSSE
jgi:hypothetical protein